MMSIVHAHDSCLVVSAGFPYLKKAMASESAPRGHQTSTTPPPSSQGTSKDSELLSAVRDISYVTSCAQAMNRVLCVEVAGTDSVITSVITSLEVCVGVTGQGDAKIESSIRRKMKTASTTVEVKILLRHIWSTLDVFNTTGNEYPTYL